MSSPDNDWVTVDYLTRKKEKREKKRQEKEKQKRDEEEERIRAEKKEKERKALNMAAYSLLPQPTFYSQLEEMSEPWSEHHSISVQQKKTKKAKPKKNKKNENLSDFPSLSFSQLLSSQSSDKWVEQLSEMETKYKREYEKDKILQMKSVLSDFELLFENVNTKDPSDFPHSPYTHPNSFTAKPVTLESEYFETPISKLETPVIRWAENFVTRIAKEKELHKEIISFLLHAFIDVSNISHIGVKIILQTLLRLYPKALLSSFSVIKERYSNITKHGPVIKQNALEALVYVVGQLCFGKVKKSEIHCAVALIAWIEIFAPTAITKGDNVLIALLREILREFPSDTFPKQVLRELNLCGPSDSSLSAMLGLVYDSNKNPPPIVKKELLPLADQLVAIARLSDGPSCAPILLSYATEERVGVVRALLGLIGTQGEKTTTALIEKLNEQISPFSSLFLFALRDYQSNGTLRQEGKTFGNSLRNFSLRVAQALNKIIQQNRKKLKKAGELDISLTSLDSAHQLANLIDGLTWEEEESTGAGRIRRAGSTSSAWKRGMKIIFLFFFFFVFFLFFFAYARYAGWIDPLNAHWKWLVHKSPIAKEMSEIITKKMDKNFDHFLSLFDQQLLAYVTMFVSFVQNVIKQ